MGKRARAKVFSEVIRSTQKTLREKSIAKNENEVRELWLKHTQNKELLQDYCTAMNTLANDHSGSRKRSLYRITWIYDSIKEYFFGDAFKINLEKEEKRVSDLEPTSMDTFLQTASSARKRYESLGKLKVLDVGSCFNPLGQFDELEVTAIDLQPAKSDVYKCDFLELKVSDKDDPIRETLDHSQGGLKFAKQQDSDSETLIQRIKRLISIFSFTRNSSEEYYEIKELRESSFDVVTFSFFLAYIPTPKLRYECCLKAFKLLKPGGILCIVTPIVNRFNGTMILFKLWRCTLAFIGFERIKYEDAEPFHGMVFRKVIVPSTLKEDAETELKLLESKKFFDMFFTINWKSIPSSVYVIQEIMNEKFDN